MCFLKLHQNAGQKLFIIILQVLSFINVGSVQQYRQQVCVYVVLPVFQGASPAFCVNQLLGITLFSGFFKNASSSAIHGRRSLKVLTPSFGVQNTQFLIKIYNLRVILLNCSQVSSLALKVHARMLGNMTPFCTKEAFVNIVDTLLRHFYTKLFF